MKILNKKITKVIKKSSDEAILYCIPSDKATKKVEEQLKILKIPYSTRQVDRDSDVSLRKELFEKTENTDLPVLKINGDFLAGADVIIGYLETHKNHKKKSKK